MQRLAIATMLVCLTVVTSDAREVSPNEIIQEAVDLLAEGLDQRHDELSADKDALYTFIDGILTPRFEREFAARAVLGRHWKAASEEQKSRFIEAFYVTLLQRYADGILEFDTDRVDIRPFRGDAKGRYSTVKTAIRLDDGTTVAVHYDLVRAKDEWRMYNVKIEGVSYVKSFRTELDAEIRSTSLDAVIERLEDEAGSRADE